MAVGLRQRDLLRRCGQPVPTRRPALTTVSLTGRELGFPRVACYSVCRPMVRSHALMGRSQTSIRIRFHDAVFHLDQDYARWQKQAKLRLSEEEHRCAKRRRRRCQSYGQRRLRREDHKLLRPMDLRVIEVRRDPLRGRLPRPEGLPSPLRPVLPDPVPVQSREEVLVRSSRARKRTVLTSRKHRVR
jgi:hypothetical protein